MAKLAARAASNADLLAAPYVPPPSPKPRPKREAPPLVMGERLWWEGCIIEPGHPLWPPDPQPTATAASGVPPAPRQPKVPPAPCPKCGSPLLWGSRDGRAHCFQCAPIPSRRFASGDAWRLLWDPASQRAYWADYTPKYFHPFAHLAAEERERQASEAALAARDEVF
jgi:hypothetical protein